MIKTNQNNNKINLLKGGNNMKNLKVLGFMAFMTLALVGCQPAGNSEHEEQLEQQVAQLEQEVTSLEKEKEDLAAAVEKAESSASSEKVEKKEKSEDTLDSLKDAVAKAVKEADKAEPSGSREENQTRFFEAKGKLQEVENRLDRFEDGVESQYRQGKIDYEKARNAEIEIERLEDKLDNSEDKLELRFGYDD